MLEWKVEIKDQGVKNMAMRAMVAIQDASRKTTDDMGNILSDAMKYFAPVASGTLKAALGKFEPQWLGANGDRGLAQRSAIFKVYKNGDTYTAEVGTSLGYAMDVNYGYTVAEDRVISIRIGGTQEFRTIKAGNHYPGHFMLEKGVDVAKAQYSRVLSKNVKAGLSRAQRSWLASPNYRPRGAGGQFVRIR